MTDSNASLNDRTTTTMYARMMPCAIFSATETVSADISLVSGECSRGPQCVTVTLLPFL